MENLETAKNIDYAPTSELANYHQQLIEKYKDSKPDEIKVNADLQSLMAFNGYYTLNCAPGAFFAIDTNMLIINLPRTQNEPPLPLYFVDLLISLDGKTSARFSFTGTFTNNQLIQNSGSLNVNLTFTRTDSTNSTEGTTASCFGTITLPNQSSATTVKKGITYNNIIPANLFSGKYYMPPNSDIANPPVMQIKDNYEVLYDNGANNGDLKQIPIYVYNMNMYFFTVMTVDLQVVFLIMGSAAEGGLACNDMPLKGTPRSLQTIQTPVVSKLVSPNPNSKELAKFSGYYQIPSISPGAFVSIQGEYITKKGVVDIYKVKIGVSLNGVTSKGYYFEAENMTFENNILTMQMLDKSISITFNRAYNSMLKSLVTISGTINDQNVIGYTLFNPVPLLVFGGVPMTDKKGHHSLTIVNDNEVFYNGTTMDNIIYVPIMYILASPSTKSTIEMSFGTNGLNGNTCIVTDYTVKPPKTSVVSAILTPTS